MRAISQFTNHVIQIRPHRGKALGDGGVETTQEPIYAVFTPCADGGFLFEGEQEEAERHFNFRGLTQHLDEATPSDPIYRMSVYDTDEAAEREGWDDATKALVEARIRERAARVPQNVLIIQSTPIPTPFPAYDDYDGEPDALVIKLVEDGHDIERVLVYERQYGPKRPHIIEALEMGVEAIKGVTVSA